ncbi:MAG TPA: ABC transporter permease subunit [Methylobacter sp.]
MKSTEALQLEKACCHWSLLRSFGILSYCTRYRFAAGLVVQENGLNQHFSFFDFIGLGSIQHWSIPEFDVFWQLALMIFPMLSITLAADQTSSDRERGTLRFIVLRSSRDRVFFGRFTGVMVIQALLIGAAAFSTLALVLSRDASLVSAALPDLLALIVNLVLIVLPFTAMMAALSAQVKSARQATLWAILIWTFMAGIISGLAYYVFSPAFNWLGLTTKISGFLSYHCRMASKGFFRPRALNLRLKL